MTSAAELLKSVDLSSLTDDEILDHLDRVSTDIKRRNNLIPGGEHPALTVLEALRAGYARPSGSPSGGGNKGGR